MNALHCIARVPVALGVALLCACAGAPSVSNVEKKTAADGSTRYTKQQGNGVFYFLPRTDLELQLEITTEDVIRGPLSSYVEKCGDPASADSLCAAEREFGFKVAKQTAEHKLCDAKDQGGKVTVSRFYSLGDKTQVTGAAVPDAKRLYFVEVTPKWYQTINASLQYSDNGLASEMTAGGSNAVGEAAVKVGAAVVSGVLLSAHGTSPVASDIEFATAYAQIRSLKATSADNDKRQKAIQELNQINQRRDDILFNAAINGDPTAILTALDTRAAKIRELYEGKLKTETVLLVRRIPLRPKGSESLDADLPQLTNAKRTVDPIELKVELPGCSQGAAPATKEPVFMQILLEPEQNAVEAALAQEESAPTVDSDQEGFRYRVPVPVRVTLHKKDTSKFTEDTRLINKEFPLEVAQLGPTLTLPRKPGSWGGSVGAAFVAGTGRLKTFKTDASASTGTTIVNQLGEEATKDRKMEALEKEEHELDLKAKIKAHNEALNTPATTE